MACICASFDQTPDIVEFKHYLIHVIFVSSDCTTECLKFSHDHLYASIFTFINIEYPFLYQHKS